MACRGVYFALNAEQAGRVLSSANDQELIRIVQDEVEGRGDRDWLCMMDKAWAAIESSLEAGVRKCGADSVLNKFVLGGRQLHRKGSYCVSYLQPEEVREIAAAAKNLSQEWFRARYFGLQRSFLGITWSTYGGPVDEQDFAYTWEYFQDARAFFEKAADAGRPVIFTVDV